MKKRTSLDIKIHQASGNLYVNYKGKRCYLGKPGAEADQRYKKLLAEWIGDHEEHMVATRLVGELALLRLKWSEGYYVKNGKQTSQHCLVKRAMQELVKDHAEVRCVDFGCRTLQSIQQRLNNPNYSRNYVNKMIGEIKATFSWGVSQEIVSVAVADALRHVSGLHKGRSKAKEIPPVRPALESTIEAVLQVAKPQLAAMIKLQRLTGMRPGELVQMRPIDVAVEDNQVWRYEPRAHKTEAHGIDRVIYIGGLSQVVLQPWLQGERDQPCFRVTEAAYRRSIARICKRIGVEKFAPNQLRHSHATEVRKLFGLEAAQVALGHTKADMTQIYAEKNQDLARKVALEIG